MRRHGMPIAVLIVIVVAALLTTRSNEQHPLLPPRPRPVPVSAESLAAIGPVTHPEIGFHRGERYREHYRKHGREFGATDARLYERLAQAMRDRPAGGDLLEAVRKDGVICRYDRATGAFLAFDPDLTIRTFFKPNDGEAYFERQMGREH